SLVRKEVGTAVDNGFDSAVSWPWHRFDWRDWAGRRATVLVVHAGPGSGRALWRARDHGLAFSLRTVTDGGQGLLQDSWSRPGCQSGRAQARLSASGAQVPARRQRRARCRGALQGSSRSLRGSERSREAQGLRPVRRQLEGGAGVSAAAGLGAGLLLRRR